MEKITIKEGCGYWNVTVYPRGGDFKRAPAGGLTIDADSIETYPGPYHELLISFSGQVICVKEEHVIRQ